ncbi:hypothetical protein ACM66B_000045 [Microbotryomycetes sp. NB124-2]
MPPKRPRNTPSQSSQSQQQTTKAPHNDADASESASQQPRPAKRARRLSAAATAQDGSEKTQSAQEPSGQVSEPADAGQQTDSATGLPDKPPPSTVPPLKRPRYAGKLRRLAPPKPVPKLATRSPTKAKPVERAKSTLSGAKVGGKAKDLGDGANTDHILVTRRKGMGFAGYLKKSCRAVIERGVTTIILTAMGAAIPLALSLGLAIRDNLPGGGEGSDSVVEMHVRTGSCAVQDEITPEDEDEDLIYQTRTKSTVQVELRVSEQVAKALSAGVKKKQTRLRGTANVRGKRRHQATRVGDR